MSWLQEQITFTITFPQTTWYTNCITSRIHTNMLLLTPPWRWRSPACSRCLPGNSDGQRSQEQPSLPPSPTQRRCRWTHRRPTRGQTDKMEDSEEKDAFGAFCLKQTGCFVWCVPEINMLKLKLKFPLHLYSHSVNEEHFSDEDKLSGWFFKSIPLAVSSRHSGKEKYDLVWRHHTKWKA